MVLTDTRHMRLYPIGSRNFGTSVPGRERQGADRDVLRILAVDFAYWLIAVRGRLLSLDRPGRVHNPKRKKPRYWRGFFHQVTST